MIASVCLCACMRASDAVCVSLRLYVYAPVSLSPSVPALCQLLGPCYVHAHAPASARARKPTSVCA